MRSELLKHGFVEFDCGEFGIWALDEKTHIYIIPGKHWSAKIYITAGGANILTAIHPVNNIYDVEDICNHHNILFRFSIDETL